MLLVLIDRWRLTHSHLSTKRTYNIIWRRVNAFFSQRFLSKRPYSIHFVLTMKIQKNALFLYLKYIPFKRKGPIFYLLLVDHQPERWFPGYQRIQLPGAWSHLCTSFGLCSWHSGLICGSFVVHFWFHFWYIFGSFLWRSLDEFH